MSTTHHVIVDGSNLATEGRSLPSLQQLDEAVRGYRIEDPLAEIIVVVDATFEHRIDASEREIYAAAVEHGELLSPPAGAIGRGDAFILKIAERAGAVVLSNDSFQEFHGEHPWLFEEGRLIGGKPVPGIGWIFTPRTPVRGVKSRAATKKAAATRPAVSAPKLKVGHPDGTRPQVGDVLTIPAEATPPAPEPAKKAAKKARKPKVKAAEHTDLHVTDAEVTPVAPPVTEPTKRVSKKAVAKVAKKTTKKAAAAESPAAVATAEAKPVAKVAKKAAKTTKKSAAAPAVAETDTPDTESRTRTPTKVVNQPLAFLSFVAAHPVASSVEGEVTSFTSHGAMVTVTMPDGISVECYAPASRLSDPPPAKAREVLTKGETRLFFVTKLDPARRVAELSLVAPQ